MTTKGAPLEAIELLYRERYADFLRTASAISGGPESGRDAVHDAFVSAVRSRAAYRGDGTIEAWVWRMVVTSALKRRPGRELLVADELPDRIAMESHGDGTSAIRTAVRALPERQRLVLYLRYYADLDYQSIASALDIQVGTVGAELHAAHGSLRRQLEEVSLDG